MSDPNININESSQGIDYRAAIRESITKLRPFIGYNSILNPQGFQLDVNAPSIRVSTLEEFKQHMGIEPDGVHKIMLDYFDGTDVEPRMGLLNIISQEGQPLEIEYRPKKDGKSWRILLGTELKIEGTASDEEIKQALDILFPGGKPNTNSKTIHIPKSSVDYPNNLEEYDRDGNKI